MKRMTVFGNLLAGSLLATLGLATANAQSPEYNLYIGTIEAVHVQPVAVGEHTYKSRTFSFKVVYVVAPSLREAEEWIKERGIEAFPRESDWSLIFTTTKVPKSELERIFPNG